MKFFLDANIPYSAIDIFRKRNLEAKHARNVGLGTADDREIFEFASENKSILVTKDLEFANPLNFPLESYHGIIVLRLPSNFKAQQFLNVLEDFLKSVDIKNLEKSITIIKLGKYRIRKI